MLPDRAIGSSKAPSRGLCHDVSYIRIVIIVGHPNKATKLAAAHQNLKRPMVDSFVEEFATYLDNTSREYGIKIPSRGRTHFA